VGQLPVGCAPGLSLVLPNLTLTDPDGPATYTTGFVHITGGLQPAQDALVFTPQNGITGTYDANTGLLTLSGSADLATWQAAFRSVQYSNQVLNTIVGIRSITVSLNDPVAQNPGVALASYEVVAKPIPTITPNGSTNLCGSESVALSVLGTPDPVWQLEWLNSSVPTGQTGSSVLTATEGSYQIRATNQLTGCIGFSNTITILVNPVPPTPVVTNADGSAEFCASVGRQLTTHRVDGLTYQWLLNNQVLPGATDTAYLATAGGAYSVRVTTAAGCSATAAPVNLTALAAPPAPTILVKGSAFFCTDGAGVELEALAGQDGLSFQWLQDGQPVAGATTRTLLVNTSGQYTVQVTAPNGCASVSAPAVINAVTRPDVQITASPGLAVCRPDSLVLSVPFTPNTLYQWFVDGQPIPGGNAPAYVPVRSGSYSVAAQAGGACTAQSDTLSVEIFDYSRIELRILGSRQVCTQNPSRLALAVIDTTLAYQWYLGDVALEGQTDPELVITQSGVYRVVGRNALGCVTQSDTVSFVVLPPAAASVASVVPACGSAFGTAVVEVNGVPPFILYWRLGTESRADTFGQSPFTVTLPRAAADSAYFDSVATGCQTVPLGSRYPVALPLPSLTLTAPDTLFCAGQQSLFTLTFTALPPYGLQVRRDGQVLFTYSNPESPLTAVAVEPGLYTYELINACGDVARVAQRFDTDTTFLRAQADSATVRLGQPLRFFAAYDSTLLSRQWRIDGRNFDSDTVVYVFPDTGLKTIQLSGLTALGCTVADTLAIRVLAPPVPLIEQIKIPSGFSPNGDGLNDTWEILPNLTVVFPKAELTIFNRWGSQVYYKSGYDNTWAAEKLPDGTYYYLLDLGRPDLGLPVFRGSVTVLR
jgi:gliding motility-associated-like protein